jgi:hypothetical protein
MFKKRATPGAKVQNPGVAIYPANACQAFYGFAAIGQPPCCKACNAIDKIALRCDHV